MADHVEQIMQDMVPELDDLRRKRIFNDEELKQIVRRRRDFEYLLKRTPSKPQDYLGYIQYEVALECLRQRRNKALHWRKKSVSDFAGIKQIHSIFNRGLSKFKADVRFWYQHVDFCLRSGCTKILSRVLLKAVKYHPREIHFWLLSADRSLKCGQIKAARTMLLRGLRFSPQSAKLWGEFVRLEVQVARKLRTLKQAEALSDAAIASGQALVGEASSAPVSKSADEDVDMEEGEAQSKGETAAQGTDIWAPARLLFRRALTRLDTSPQACIDMFVTVAGCIREAAASQPSNVEGPVISGLHQWHRELWEAVAERRPGMSTAPAAWSSALPEVCIQIWELWWDQEREEGRGWRGIARAVVGNAPIAVICRCALRLGAEAKSGDQSSGAPLKALMEFLSSARVTCDDEAALAVLEALEPNISFAEVREHAAALLALRAQAPDSGSCSPPCARLRLLARGTGKAAHSETENVLTVLKEACNVPADDAGRLFSMAAREIDRETVTTKDILEILLRALAPKNSPQQVLQAYLSDALLYGVAQFQTACDDAVAISAKLWDTPHLRMEVLAGVLDAQLRVHSISQLPLQQMQSRFEALLELLDDADPAKVDWWVKYVEFVQRAAHYGCGGILPSSSSLHWRAMRSVADQALYTERSQQLLQLF